MERSDFPLVDDVEMPTGGGADGAHVVDYEIQRVLSMGWQQYVATVRELAGGDLPPAVVRQITTSFESETYGGRLLALGVRALHRTRRSLVLEEQLWDEGSGQLVASSRVVVASVDRSSGRAPEIAPRLWAAIEAFEGHPIEMIERGTPITLW